MKWKRKDRKRKDNDEFDEIEALTPIRKNRCGATGKIIFDNENIAWNRAGEIINNESNRRSTPNAMRTYRCQYCGCFHLTSKSLYD